MLGRGALGKPWIFSEIKSGKDYRATTSEIKKLCLDLAKKSDDIWGEHGITESKKHFCWYLKGTHETAEYRRKLMLTKTLKDVEEIIRK